MKSVQVHLREETLKRIELYSHYFNSPQNQFQLQLFAAEDEGRTEPGSERRRREEREKGNVPKSNEVSSVLVLLGAIAVIYLTGEKFIREASTFITKTMLKGINQDRFGNEEFRVLFGGLARDFFGLLWPVFSVTVVLAIVGNVLQTGFIFTPRALAFRFDRLVPNFKRVLPNRQTLFNLGKSLTKVIVIGIISYLLIESDFLRILLLGNLSVNQALVLIGTVGFKIMMFVGIFLLAIAITDFFFQKSEFEESLKQTPSEAKRELKEDTGDPLVKSRRMQLARDFMQREMLKAVPKADVVITNPTHYAVAIGYRPGIDPAPIVLAKGEDRLALAIRKIARDNDIPIHEDRMTARLLYEQTNIGEPIPALLFDAIAKILRTIRKFRLKLGYES